MFGQITVKKQNAWNLMDFWDKEESVRALSLEEEEARKEAREMYKKWVLSSSPPPPPTHIKNNRRVIKYWSSQNNLNNPLKMNVPIFRDKEPINS